MRRMGPRKNTNQCRSRVPVKMEIHETANNSIAMGIPSPTKLASDSLIGRRESASLFLFDKDSGEEMAEDVAVREAERVENQKLADALAEEERERCVSEAKDHENELEIVRQINIEYSISVAEEEQQRRMRELEITKVQEELLRERNALSAAAAVETERQRRIKESEGDRAESEVERRVLQQKVVEAMEHERIRRLSSAEHAERRVAGFSSDIDGDGEMSASPSTFSEIPVVHASKMLVDDTTEWRCFILSENPEQEKDNLRALRMSLEEDLKESDFPELVGDVRLLRFLRGHKQNVAVAATKYREMLAHRKNLNLDDIRRAIMDKNLTPGEFPGFSTMIQHLPTLNAYDLTDAANDHVFYFEMSGYADFKGLMEQVSDDDWTQFFLYEMEYRSIRLDQLSRHNEKLIKTVFVRDLQGFSIARFNPRLLTRVINVIRIATACYPETTHETLLLHTPWIFHKIWNAIKPKLAETQLSKIHMSSDAYAHLVDLVGGRDRLPKLLGGKNLTQVIPQTGFLGRDSFVLLCDDGATQAEIKAGGTLQLPFRIAANDTVCWEYEVKSHDIEFSVKLRTQGEGGAVEVDKVPKTRVAARESIAGSYTATQDGTVVLSWDNAYSWTRGKTVAYKAKVVKATHDFSCLDISGNDCV